MFDSVFEAGENGLLTGVFIAILAIVVRFVLKKYYDFSNKDFVIKHFNYEKSTDLIKIKKCLEYWVNKKNNLKIEQVSKRLLDFDYKDEYANQEIIKAIFFNRKYVLKDEMYFNHILMQFETRSEKAIYHYLKGVYFNQNKQEELGLKNIEESFNLEPNLKAIYPEFF